MKLHSKSDDRGQCFRCPARRALRGGGMKFERERCLAEVPCDTERPFGPTFYVKEGTELLLSSALKYNTPEFKHVYAQRPSVERVFSVLKSPRRRIRTRRAVILQSLLVFQAINMHIQAWIKDDLLRSRDGVNTS